MIFLSWESREGCRREYLVTPHKPLYNCEPGGKGWLEANINFKYCHLSYVEVIPGILEERKKKKRTQASFSLVY